MLLDEPFSGLDATLRNQIRDETLHVLKQAGAATLMVTHDPEEAMFMADRVAMMCGGRLIQCGPPAELYSDPADKFVASFFGDINRLQGTVRDGRVATPFGAVDAPGYAEGSPVEVLIRPEALRLQQTSRGLAGPRPAGQQAARVMASRLLGRSSMIHLAVDGAAPGPGDGPEDGPKDGHGERADAPPEAAAGGGGVHVHARIPGRFLPPENELLEVELDRSQTFVFPADGVT
jgi:iron(III) transport system ATP-binding protein